MTWSVIQKKLISIERESYLLMASFAMPASVTLSQWIGVGGCLWPSSCRKILRTFPSLELSNRAPSSASAADATTNLNITKNTYIALFKFISFPLMGFDRNI